MTPEQITTVRSLRSKGRTLEEICRLTGIAHEDAKNALVRSFRYENDMSENDIVDGERIADRIQRITAAIKARKLLIYRRNKTIIAEEI